MAKSAVRARTLDFSNVKESSGISPKHLEEGEYLGKIIEVRDDPAKDGEAMWNFIIQLTDHKTATYAYYVKLVENQLWKLRNLFIAAGVDIPKKAVKIDPNKVLNKIICVVLEDDEYDGKMKSVIAAVMPKEEFEGYSGETDTSPADDDDDEDDEDDEPAPVAKKRGRPKKVVEEEPEDDDEDEDEEEEPAPKKRGRGRPKKVVEEEEDDDEDEEPAPRKKRGRPAKAAAPAKKKRRAVEDDDDDLDIDL